MSNPISRFLPLIAALALLQVSCRAGTPAPPNVRAPEAFRVEMETSRGPLTLDVTRANAPIGVDRFYNMVKAGYLDGARFFRMVPGFVVQFGLSGDPKLTQQWDVQIKDDPPKRSNSNVRGTVVFAATEDPNSRTCQLFINLGNNRGLDSSGFVPIGRVVKGMDIADQFFSGYGEDPDQNLIKSTGDAYLSKTFPSLDFIKTARIAPADKPGLQ